MEEYWMDEHYQYVNTELILQCFYYNGQKIKKVKEKVRVRLKRSSLAMTQVLSEKVHLTCLNCGSSISLKNGGKCLYCNSKLNLADIDWVIDIYNVL